MTSVRVDGSGGGAAAASAAAAAFVAKTYRMVEERGTDSVIAWGRQGNSFVVLDPFVFSQTLLPAHFKHSNFSSFVRQLNTYGFRKVDSDRWEFAHVSFLRGQTHLLRHIVRRGSAKRKDGIANTGDAVPVDNNEITMVATEVVRLKREQRAIDDKVAAMWRRVQETERKPKQMLAFLIKVVGDRQRLNRLVGSSGSGSVNEADDVFAGEPVESGEKRPRLLTEDDGGNADPFGPAVDFAGFYADGAVFGDIGVEAGSSGDGVGASFAFPVDSGYTEY